MNDENCDLFLSYDFGKDNINVEKVRKIYERLKKELNLKIWWDQTDSNDADEISQKYKAISNSSLFVCFVTREYSKNEKCMRDLEIASDSNKRTIFFINENVENMSHKHIISEIFDDAAFYLGSNAYLKTEEELIASIKSKLNLETPDIKVKK